jgi:hypothetical protein
LLKIFICVRAKRNKIRASFVEEEVSKLLPFISVEQSLVGDLCSHINLGSNIGEIEGP